MSQSSRSDALKPCPFCGGTAKLEPATDADSPVIGCKKRSCLGFCLVIVEPGDTVARAVKRWNTRAAVSERGTPSAWRVKGPNGLEYLTPMDASKPEFWRDGRIADGYSITPLFERNEP